MKQRIGKIVVAALLSVGGGVAYAHPEDVWTNGLTDPQTGSIAQEGVSVYAYCGKDGQISNIWFRAFRNLPSTGLNDVSLTLKTALGSGVYVTEANNPDISATVRDLLSGGMYDSNSSQYTVTLRNLVAGKKYLAQFWVCDARADVSYTLTFDGTVTIPYCGNEQRSGGWAVCRFTADAPEKVVNVRCSAGGSPVQLNALQLRDLDGASVAWEVRTTAGAADVADEGTPLYAYHGCGVNFAGSGSLVGVNETVETNLIGKLRLGETLFAGAVGETADWDGDISFTPSVGLKFEYFFQHGDELNYAPAYANLLSGGFWVNVHKPYRMCATLNGLTAGKRYLVQHWVGDNRAADYAKRRVTVDGTAALRYNQGVVSGAVSHVVGTFTAVGSSQPVHLLYDAVDNGTPEPLFGAIQVRELDGTYPKHGIWTQGETDAVTGSVDTRGTLLYAYSGRATTLDGLTTMAMVSGTAPMKDDVLVPFENVHFTPDAYLPSSVVVADGVRNLVGGGIYRDRTERGALTFRKLVPGRRYLIQLWSCDMRSAERDYTMLYDHAVRVGYFAGTAGSWATYVFTATDETVTIPAQGNHDYFSWQLNAVQVRQLDDADDTVVWSGGENVTAAWTRSYFVKTTVGRTTCAEALSNLRRVVVSAGTLAFTAGQPSALALEAWDTGRIEVDEGVVLSGVSVRGTGTIAGAGRVAFTAGGTIDMPSALTVDGVVWELAHGTTLAYADGANLAASRILIADPAARLTGRDAAAVVTVAGTPVGEPTFLFPAGEAGKWTVPWDASASAFVLKKRIGLAIVLR